MEYAEGIGAFEGFANHLIQYILVEFIPVREYTNIITLNKKMKSVVDKDQVWRNLYKKYAEKMDPSLINNDVSWKVSFIRRNRHLNVLFFFSFTKITNKC
jgi:hypothetical protein